MALEKILSKEKLIEFEEEISGLYKQGKIHAPVHLSKGNEAQLIQIFRHIQPDDWVFSSYRNHYHALLKGIPREWLKEEIMAGHSMHIMSSEHNFYTSSIVAGHLPIALGTAMALKRKNSPNRVWAFCGDMAAETGIFHECAKYAAGHGLPIAFVVEDDGLSVYTPTREAWGCSSMPALQANVMTLSAQTLSRTQANVFHYKYQRGWPHHGIGMWVDFPEDKKQEVDYKNEIAKAMAMLAEDSRTFFIGQTVGCKGSPIFSSLEGVPMEKRLELPVAEEMQMGMSTGLALGGFIPVSIYPRMDFLILATSQLVNHLDKTKALSQGRFQPNVILRTMVGSKSPLNPGPQHYQDHSEAYRRMLTNVEVIQLNSAEEISSAYSHALHRKDGKSTLLVEYADLYA